MNYKRYNERLFEKYRAKFARKTHTIRSLNLCRGEESVFTVMNTDFYDRLCDMTIPDPECKHKTGFCIPYRFRRICDSCLACVV